jgi:hypothetical protein
MLRPETAKIYRLLKEGWASAVFEALSDKNDLIVMEGLNVMTEFYYAFKKKNFTDYFKPHFDRMLGVLYSLDAPYNFKQAFARYSGKFLNKLTMMDMANDDVRERIFGFFKACLASSVDEEVPARKLSDRSLSDVDGDDEEERQNAELGSDRLCTLAAINLPCFFKLMQTPAMTEAKGIEVISDISNVFLVS